MKIMPYGHKTAVQERLVRLIEELGCVALTDEALPLSEAVVQLRPEVVIMDASAQPVLETAYRPAIIAIGKEEDCTPKLFKMNLVDFLVSPISKDALAESLDKACTLNAAQAWQLAKKNTDDKKARQYLAARTHKGVELISMNDVYYFSADQKYVKVRHKGGVVLIDETLKELEEEFASRMFRIHRSALINLNYLDILESVGSGQHQVRLRGVDETLCVSRRHLPALREKIHSI